VELPGGRPTRLTVEATSVVDSRTAVIRSEARVTGLILVTCYPFDAVVPGGPLRYVVTAAARL
jgi:sortase A